MMAFVVAALLSGGPPDAGAGVTGVGDVRIFDARFDGRELSGLTLMCAEGGDILVDERMEETFRIKSVRSCLTQRELPSLSPTTPAVGLATPFEFARANASGQS